MKYFRLVILLVSLCLSGCFSVLPLRIETPAPYATYKITEVVDASTSQVISDNMLFLTIRREGVEDVQFFSEDITEYNMQLPIGARVLILVEAPGYQDWEMEIENVEYVAEGVEIQVEMVPVK